MAGLVQKPNQYYLLKECVTSLEVFILLVSDKSKHISYSSLPSAVTAGRQGGWWQLPGPALTAVREESSASQRQTGGRPAETQTAQQTRTWAVNSVVTCEAM